jgi:protein-S-isoprenylcysteine O-methyltransferase Ste14
MKGKSIIISFLSALYILVILFSWGYYPSLKLWKLIDWVFLNVFPEITLFRTIHLVIGLPIFIYSMTNVIEIVRINQRAQLRKNVPKYLLKEGYYSKMRHPMYTMIILIEFSLFFSLCSSLGILFGLLFTLLFMLFGLYEEKYQLLPILGEEYKEYSRKVKIRFFPFPLKILLLLLYLLLFLGIFL